MLAQANPLYESMRDNMGEAAGHGPAYWANRTSERFSQVILQNSERWLAQAAAAAGPPPAQTPINIDTLNIYQRFAYDAIVDHDNRRRLDPVNTSALHAVICGTAGAGKTYLISALRDHFRSRCKVMAPTGVAADNIGGVTYHSAIPVPRDAKKVAKIQIGKERLNDFIDEFNGVTHLIFDEMSMIGRRSLGVIDEVLKQIDRKRAHLDFGGFNIILVGDHGQLAPVKDTCCFDIKGCRMADTRER